TQNLIVEDEEKGREARILRAERDGTKAIDQFRTEPRSLSQGHSRIRHRLSPPGGHSACPYCSVPASSNGTGSASDDPRRTSRECGGGNHVKRIEKSGVAGEAGLKSRHGAKIVPVTCRSQKTIIHRK